MSEGKYTEEKRRKNNLFELKFFRLEVLDRYRENPIYSINEYPVSMSLSIKDGYYNDPKIKEEDKIDIQSLGYAYKKKNDSRVIVTYLSYLARLSKKHQYYWASFEEEEECKIDKDFFDQEFGAEFTDRVNIFDAFIQELIEINKICSIQGYPPLFKNDFESNKPKNLCCPTKSTLESYHNLIHLLDKLLSDNINRQFFEGKIETNKKKNLDLLEEYLNKFFKLLDPQHKEEMLKQFRLIRKTRCVPAHEINNNEYDPSYFEKIKELVEKSYRSIRTLRLLLTNFPNARKSYKAPEWLQKGKII